MLPYKDLCGPSGHLTLLHVEPVDSHRPFFGKYIVISKKIAIVFLRSEMTSPTPPL